LANGLLAARQVSLVGPNSNVVFQSGRLRSAPADLLDLSVGEPAPENYFKATDSSLYQDCITHKGRLVLGRMHFLRAVHRFIKTGSPKVTAFV